MIDLEEQIAERFKASARSLGITPPPAHTIVELVARRRRQHIARGAAGLTAAAMIVVGLVFTTRGDGGDSTITGNDPTSTNPPASRPGRPLDGETALDVAASTPASDRWSRMPDNGLWGRSQHLLVATDAGTLVWGGSSLADPAMIDGAYFDEATRTWRALPPAPLATDRGDAVGVWTGAEVVVINGVSANVKAAAFDPVAFSWRALPDPPVDNAANATSRAVFIDGSIVLLSIDEDGADRGGHIVRLDDLQHGDWRVGSPPPITLRSSVDVIVAGHEIMVVGQVDHPESCAVLHILSYSPATNSWRELPAGPVANRADVVAVWTGSELFIGGGGSCDLGVASAELETRTELLDPVTQQWRAASAAPVGFFSSYRYADLWTGKRVAVLSPAGAPMLYDPATDRWDLGPPINGAHPVAPNQTPFVFARGTIIVSGGRILEGGELCCSPVVGTYEYTIPGGQ